MFPRVFPEGDAVEELASRIPSLCAGTELLRELWILEPAVPDVLFAAPERTFGELDDPLLELRELGSGELLREGELPRSDEEEDELLEPESELRELLLELPELLLEDGGV